MNITRENTDDLNAILKVEVEKTDYEGNVEKVLRDYRKKANIKGFRPGMVPFGLIKKMYGRAVQIDEINKVVTENIQKFLTDEKIEILGDPLPRHDENENLDFDTRESFTFSFDLGLAPAFETKLSKKNKVTYYEIAADDKMRNDYLDNYSRRYGRFEKADTSEEKDILKGKIEALDENGDPLPDGLFADDTTLSVELIKDSEIQQPFIGKNAYDTVTFDLRKALPNDNEIAGLTLAPGGKGFSVVAPGDVSQVGAEAVLLGVGKVVLDRQVELTPDEFIQKGLNNNRKLAEAAKGWEPFSPLAINAFDGLKAKANPSEGPEKAPAPNAKAAVDKAEKEPSPTERPTDQPKNANQ